MKCVDVIKFGKLDNPRILTPSTANTIVVSMKFEARTIVVVIH